MQRKFILRTVTGLGLLAFAGCGTQPESTTESTTTTTVVTMPTAAPSKIVVETAPVTVVEAKKPVKMAPVAKKTPAKPPVTVKTTVTLPKPATPVEGNLGPIPKTTTKLISEDIKIGVGPTAEVGKTVSVHYTGTLTDGTKFDSSLDRGTPFDFPLGGGQVIKGWDQGVAGMKVGGKRRLIIPADLAYGDNPRPGGIIKPGDTLVFTVELLGVQ